MLRGSPRDNINCNTEANWQWGLGRVIRRPLDTSGRKIQILRRITGVGPFFGGGYTVDFKSW